jgi:hypothetical protein
VLTDPYAACAGLTFPTTSVALELYYPGDEFEDRAEGRFPVVVFHHGNGLDYQQYTDLFEHLQQLGFVVLNVSAGTNPVTGFTVPAAIDAMRCALRWFYLEEGYFDEFGTCDIVLSGHSRGGAAAHNLRTFLFEPGQEPELRGTRVRGEILLANSSPGDANALQPYGPQRAVPMLVLGSSTDEDVPGQAIAAYDRVIRESTIPVPTGLAAPYKGLVWIYDLPHTGFGGGVIRLPEDRLTANEYVAKGRAVTTAYVERFLRWQIFGEPAQRRYFVDEDFPPGGGGPTVVGLPPRL